jgi:hypothetical protein
MRRRALAALEHRPWTVALIAAAGCTLLFPSAAALLAPPDLLDAAVALGEFRLKVALAALFVLSACVARLCLWRRELYLEEDDDEAAAPLPLGENRHAPEREAPARSYLR